jgi:hypothetical protein
MDMENKTIHNKAQLYHLLINGKWFNLVRNYKSYSSVELGYDHRIVTTPIKVGLSAQIKES